MDRVISMGIATLFALGSVACGEPAEQVETEAPDVEPAEALTVPGWMQVDRDARTVSLHIVAGQTPDNNRWNFNGYSHGNATLVVPEGYTVTLHFENQDPANPHSVAVDSRTGNFPATFDSPAPVFEGAVTSGATSLTDATKSGESETITFTADRAGDYSLVCYVPAHAVTGMWIGFRVSADGQAGLQT